MSQQSIEEQIAQAISEAAGLRAKSIFGDRESKRIPICITDFKAGALFLLPVLMKAISQRDDYATYFYSYDCAYEDVIAYDNVQLIQLLETPQKEG